MTKEPADDTDLAAAHDILEAFNAEEVIDDAGEPPDTDGTPASDADAQAPG